MHLPDGARLVRLHKAHTIKSFDCGDPDLNEFIARDSLNILNNLLAVTYIIENENSTIAFYSVLNDKVLMQEFDSNRGFSRWRESLFGDRKKFRSYPAVKIGRLGVNNDFQSQGIGTIIIDYIKYLFSNNNKTGCRFITVDAYSQSLKFYEIMGFYFLARKMKIRIQDKCILIYWVLKINPYPDSFPPLK